MPVEFVNKPGCWDFYDFNGVTLLTNENFSNTWQFYAFSRARWLTYFVFFSNI